MFSNIEDVAVTQASYGTEMIEPSLMHQRYLESVKKVQNKCEKLFQSATKELLLISN